jgi:two-component system nitrate/nitrite response regulator NarL
MLLKERAKMQWDGGNRENSTCLSTTPLEVEAREVRTNVSRFPRNSRNRSLPNRIVKKTVPSPVIRIVIADDHALVRMAVRDMLESPRFEIVAEADDGVQALEQVKNLRPDVLLLDLRMPNVSGIETLRELALKKYETNIVLLAGAVDQKEMLEGFQLGVRGIASKVAGAAELRECILSVMDGWCWAFGKAVADIEPLMESLAHENAEPPAMKFRLTPRELQIIGLIAQGYSNRAVATECLLSEETVKHHLKRIFNKTGVPSRLALAVFARAHQLV